MSLQTEPDARSDTAVLACPVCGSRDLRDIGAYRGASAELKDRSKSACSHCGLVCASPMPTEAEWAEYNANYFQRAHGTGADSDDARLFRSALGKFRADHIARFLDRNGISVSSVLEIGPGHGELVAALRQRLAGLRYLASETDETLIAPLRAMGVEIRSLEDLASRGETVDLVIISHVLEHTIHPVSFLQEATRSLRDGGALFVEVPCLDHLYKPEDEPHLLFFDKQPLDCALRSAGFEGAELSYVGEPHELLQRRNRQNGVAALAQKVIGRISRYRLGRHPLLTRQEWSVIRPFSANRISEARTRWLRAMAVKRPR